ncbi:MAG: universal stress protein [Motiliproteus sp.]
MPFNNKLLIVLTSGAQKQPALERGRLIAKRLGATLHLMADKKPETVEHDEWLQAVAQTQIDDGLDVVVDQWQSADLLPNVLGILKKHGCGLLIKFSDQSNPLAEAFFTPRDWKLLRYAPCPVLMVKQQESWEGRALIAAIDADPDDQDHHLLNQQIIRMSAQIAELSGSNLHLVSAFPAPMQSADAHSQLREQIQHRYQQNCEALCQQLDCQPDQIEVAEGPPETMIPAYSRSVSAALVIMGTVARKGLRGALLGGNTAEAILAQLRADVLTLNPRGSDEILDILLQQQED